jgi:hypothetical protein
MDAQSELQIRDLWYPQAAATGLPFARGRLNSTNVLLVHAPPSMLTVEVRSEDGRRLAYAQDMPQAADARSRVWPCGENRSRAKICGLQRATSANRLFCQAGK